MEFYGWIEGRGVTLIGGDLDESPMALLTIAPMCSRSMATAKVLHAVRSVIVVMVGVGEA
jgi:tRNA-splicing ligase RtcB (3'-phosphate/5'-hydroxy nucleic acid ligase)